MIIMGGVFSTSKAIKVVTEALASECAVVVEPWRSGHDVTVMDYSDPWWTSRSQEYRVRDAEWAENGREGDVWVRPPLTHVDYPHVVGYLYDCPACESRCHCDVTEVLAGRHEPCIYCGERGHAASA